MNERELFITARQKRDAAEQAAFLDEACSGDAELRLRVLTLLDEHDQLGSFLELPAGPPGASVAEQAGTERTWGVLAGRYKLVEAIGEGGMGSVWMAQQTEPVRRLVALKLIKRGMDSRQVLARFEAERQALALMDHPNIAKVLDAGATPDGRPFFVMELVKGVPITKYCDDHRLTPRQRLELFIPVCQAIQHAHQKGVIHRDIKPSNVLVALYDDQPVIKVIDFGVAKAADHQLTDRTLVTGFGAVIGTLDYMSPEQAELNNRDIDTRSDIYSLGVLLYELLTGTTPLDRKRHKESGFVDLLRLIREGEPPKPSTRLSESKDTLPAISAQRHTEPARLTNALRGELDWIVMKALDKDRNRRYQTAIDLALDVRRYLDSEPVQACPPSRSYRLRRLLSRNKKVAIAAGLLLLSLVVGIVGTSVGLIWAMRERDAAEDARREAETNLLLAQQVVDEMYTQVAADVAQVPRMQPFQRDLLQKALRFYQELAARKTEDPAIRLLTAHALLRVGSIQIAFRQMGEAEATLHQSLKLLDDLAAELPAHPRRRKLVGLVHWNLGALLHTRRLFPEAEQAYRQAVKSFGELADADPREAELRQLLAGAYRELGNVLRDAPTAALEAHQNSVRLGKELVNDDPSQSKRWGDLAAHHVACGRTHTATGHLHKAEASFRQGLCAYEKAKGPLDRSTYRGLFSAVKADLARVLAATGREDAAEQTWREALALEDRHAAQFPDLPGYRQQLAAYQIDFAPLLVRRDKADEAARLLRSSAEICEQLIDVLPLEAADNEIYKLGFAARHLGEAGDGTAAESIARKALALAKRRLADSPGDRAAKQLLAESHGMLGAILQQSDKLKDATVEIRHQRAILKALIADLPSASHYRYHHARSGNLLGIALRSQPGENENALRVHRQSVEACTQLIAEFREQMRYHHELVRSYYLLGTALRTAGRWSEAAKAYHDAVAACDPLLKECPTSISFPRSGDLVYEPLLPPAVHRELAWLLATCPDASVRDAAGAVKAARKAVELDPKGDHWNTLGVAYYRAGDCKDAVVALEKSMALRQGGDSLDWFFLAMAHAKLGDPTAARQWYDGALEWMELQDPDNVELRRLQVEAAAVLDVTK